MIPYKKLTIDDRDWIIEKLKESDYRGSEYCFTNQLLWGRIAGLEAAVTKNCLCTIYRKEGSEALHDFPAGNGDKKQALISLMEDDRERDQNTVIRGLTHLTMDWMENTFPGIFSYQKNRAEWDYLYLTQDLSGLVGRKYHGKRNHIARFTEAGEWNLEKMTPDNIWECREMYHSWLEESKERLDVSALNEKSVVEGCFQYFKELALQGALIRQQGRVVGFSIGEPLNSDTYIVHIEKAYPGVQGAYPVMNREFVRSNMMEYRYVNREDDLGVEGLRKAKLSYHPALLVEKYTAVLKHDNNY